MASGGISYWAKRRRIRKRVTEHLAYISEQNAIENDHLSDLENSEFCDHDENYSYTVGLHSLRSDSDDDSETAWYDAANEPCEPDFCQQEGHTSGDESEHNTSDSDSESTPQPITHFIHDWATKHNISRIALNELLAYLQQFHKSLPKDSRTLLKTPTDYDIRTIQGGLYHHFGLQSALTKILDSCKATVDLTQNEAVSLQLNIDGLPIFKNSGTQFWPILCRVISPIVTEPFVVGLFCGERKPKDICEYLLDLVSELKTIETEGLTLEGFSIPIRISVSCVICDAPARAYVKQVKQYNAYFGCDKCTQKGEWHEKVTFPAIDAPLRTDVHFDELQHKEHSDGVSPFADTSLGMVTNFPLDFMHLVCLGVMKRLIWLWVKSPTEKCIRIGRHMVTAISDNLLKFHSFLPREFARKCRSLSEFERWKATEFRQVLLYSGSVALKNNLPKKMYEHFLLLFVSIYYLASSYYCESHAEYAHELLCVFVEQFGKIYGKDMLVYNVHGLIHLAADVKKFGPLDSFSAFPFESFLGRLKKLLRKPNHPLQQIIRRLYEKADIGFKITNELTTVVKHKHSAGPLPEKFSNYFQYREVTYNNLVFSTKCGDSCCQAGSKIGLIRNILCDDSGVDVMLLVEPYKKKSTIFFKTTGFIYYEYLQSI